jgi:hypothetical protein
MAKKLSPFEQAFADARKAYLAGTGDKNFTFNGKLYNTNLAGEGSKKAEDIQSSTDAVKTVVSRQSGPPTTTQGATPSKSSNDDSKLSDTAKGFRAAREKFGDTPFVDALMSAGKAGIVLQGGKLLGPAGRAVGAMAKKVFSDKTPAAPKDMDPPLFKSNTKPEKSGFEEAYPRDFKKGGEIKKYAKGGKIDLDACGVSTHVPSKRKNPNW